MRWGHHANTHFFFFSFSFLFLFFSLPTYIHIYTYISRYIYTHTYVLTWFGGPRYFCTTVRKVMWLCIHMYNQQVHVFFSFPRPGWGASCARGTYFGSSWPFLFPSPLPMYMHRYIHIYGAYCRSLGNVSTPSNSREATVEEGRAPRTSVGG